MIHEILESLAEDTHEDTRMTCTHPTESVRKEKRGGWTYYTCDACGAKRADFVVGCELHMGEWSGGRKPQQPDLQATLEAIWELVEQADAGPVGVGGSVPTSDLRRVLEAGKGEQ